MKKNMLLATVLLLWSCAIWAQQITQQFSFTSNDLQISQSGIYKVLQLADAMPLSGEESAGKPQIPLQHFKLL